jgi:hypothetical protein
LFLHANPVKYSGKGTFFGMKVFYAIDCNSLSFYSLFLHEVPAPEFQI